MKKMRKKWADLGIHNREKNGWVDLPESLQRIPFGASSQRKMRFMADDSGLLLWGDDGYLKLWDSEAVGYSKGLHYHGWKTARNCTMCGKFLWRMAVTLSGYAEPMKRKRIW